MDCRRWWIALVWFVVCSGLARGDDAYFHVTQDGLAKIVDRKLPGTPPLSVNYWWLAGLHTPYVALDGKGEAYVLSPRMFEATSATEEESLSGLLVRAPAGADVTGRLYLPKSDIDGIGMVELRFKIRASDADGKFQKDFLRAKALHYEWLTEDGLPGGAWFRHEARRRGNWRQQDR